MNDEAWITIADAVAMSGYHAEHVRRLLRQGDVEGRKVSIVWLVNRDSLLSYLAKGKAAEDRRWGPKTRS